MTAVANVPAAAKRKLEFAYDCYGRRISKKVYVWDAGTSSYSLNSERHFVYDGWNLIAELTAQNTPVRTYMWGLDTSGSMQGAGGIGGLLAVSNASDSTTHFVAMDGSGNCMALVNADTGAVSAEMEYGPFGEPIRRTGPMAKFFPFGFSTKYTDQESGLLSYGGNTMDPRTGRWLSRDSMEESGSIGLYVFVFNNPLSFVDLLGRQPISPNNNPVPVGTFTGPNPPPLNPGQTASPAVTINGKVTVWNIFETPFVWLEKDGRLADCMVLIVVGHNTYVEPFLKGYKPSEYTKLGMLGCWSGIKAVPEEGHAIGFDFPKPTGVIGWPQPPIEEYQKPLNAGFESFEKMMEAAFTSAKKEGQKLVQDADCKCKKSTVAVKCQAPQPNDKYTEWLNQKSWCNQVIATYERK
jgi:RHS repeat-associated protein